MLVSFDGSYRIFARNHLIVRTAPLRSRQLRGTSWTAGTHTHTSDKDRPVAVERPIELQRAYHDAPSNARSHYKLAHGVSRNSWRPFSTVSHARRALVSLGRPAPCSVRNKSTAAASSSQPAATSPATTENKWAEGKEPTVQKVKSEGKGKGAEGVKQAPNGKKLDGGEGVTAQKPKGAKEANKEKESDGGKATPSKKPEGTKEAAAKKPEKTKPAPTKKAEKPKAVIEDRPSKADGVKETPSQKSEGPKEATVKKPEETKVAPTKQVEELKVILEDRPSDAAPVKKTGETGDPTQHLISLTIHCDGSLMEGNRVGAAAVLRIPGQQDKIYRRHFVDHTDTSLSSLDAEMISLALGLVCVARYLHSAPAVRPSTVAIACDNASAVAAADPRQPYRNALHELLLNRIRAFENTYPDIALVFVHVPGHSGVPGNEQAHVEARRVARDPSIATNERLPDSLKRMLPDAPKPPKERAMSYVDSLAKFLFSRKGLLAVFAAIFVLANQTALS